MYGMFVSMGMYTYKRCLLANIGFLVVEEVAEFACPCSGAFFLGQRILWLGLSLLFGGHGLG